VIVLDANILLYAYDETAELWLGAKEWVSGIFSGEDPVGLPWQTIGAFLRISTNPSLRGSRFTMKEAAEFVDSWLGEPNVQVLAPGNRHWAILEELLVRGQVRGPRVTEAQLAAIAIEYGGVLHTTDRDFARFPGLRWTNPLNP
jgi:toxin-antitoxin system PIN domain toxin